jgi:hypothetical protein
VSTTFSVTVAVLVPLTHPEALNVAVTVIVYEPSAADAGTAMASVNGTLSGPFGGALEGVSVTVLPAGAPVADRLNPYALGPRQAMAVPTVPL